MRIPKKLYAVVSTLARWRVRPESDVFTNKREAAVEARRRKACLLALAWDWRVVTFAAKEVKR